MQRKFYAKRYGNTSKYDNYFLIIEKLLKQSIVYFVLFDNLQERMELISSFILTNEKRGDLKVVAFDRSPFNYSRRDFQTNQCSPIL
jgi:hypothetical protein